MSHLKLIFLSGILLTLWLVTGCKPAATPMPTSSPSPNLVSPQQVVPTATREVPPNPAVTPATSPAVAKSGIRITAKLGNACPGPQRADQKCEAPYQGEFSITTSQNTVTLSATTNPEGQVTVELPPGDYTITPKIEGRFPSGAPVDVTVPAGQVVEVSIELDSGMR